MSETTQAPINNHFINMLTIHREGDAISELSKAMAEVTAAALLTGRAGHFSIKFTIKPAGKQAVAVTVEDDITVKLPKADKCNSIFFSDENGALLRDNPRQMKLALKSVEGGKAIEVETLKEARAN